MSQARLLTLITLAAEKHKLVHVGVYMTGEPPKPKKKTLYYMHFNCGKKIARGEFKRLPPRTRKFPTCIRCARWAYPQR